jgi:hypothetical protein
MPRLTPKMYTLFNEVAMLACEEWRPTDDPEDEWWQGVSYEDKEYDINLHVDYNGCIRATVWPVINGQTKTDDDSLAMRLW